MRKYSGQVNKIRLIKAVLNADERDLGSSLTTCTISIKPKHAISIQNQFFTDHTILQLFVSVK